MVATSTPRRSLNLGSGYDVCVRFDGEMQCQTLAEEARRGLGAFELGGRDATDGTDHRHLAGAVRSVKLFAGAATADQIDQEIVEQ